MPRWPSAALIGRGDPVEAVGTPVVKMPRMASESVARAVTPVGELVFGDLLCGGGPRWGPENRTSSPGDSWLPFAGRLPIGKTFTEQEGRGECELPNVFTERKHAVSDKASRLVRHSWDCRVILK